MPVTVSSVPSSVKNRYAFDFPIRPGETRFEVSYKLPYSGSYQFSLTPESQLSELGVLLPKSMKFNGLSGGFAQDVDEAGLAVFFAKNVQAKQEVKFSVSGEGLVPTEAPGGGNPSQPAGESGGAPIPSSSGGTHEALWFVVGALVVLIVGGAFLVWRKSVSVKVVSEPKAAKAASKSRTQAQNQSVNAPQGNMLDVLKEELFQLETDRVSGKISQEEYEKSKAGLDTLFRRQMKRK